MVTFGQIKVQLFQTLLTRSADLFTFSCCFRQQTIDPFVWISWPKRSGGYQKHKNIPFRPMTWDVPPSSRSLSQRNKPPLSAQLMGESPWRDTFTYFEISVPDRTFASDILARNANYLVDKEINWKFTIRLLYKSHFALAPPLLSK